MSKKIVRYNIEFNQGENHFLTENSVSKLLIQNGSEVKKVSKSLLDLHNLEQEVKANPYVEEASVSMNLANELLVKVQQRKPLFRLKNSNEDIYVDKEFRKMPLSSYKSARVPLVTGSKTPQEIEEVSRLILFISKDEFLKKEVVGVAQKNRSFVLNVRSGKYLIDLGSIENLDLKFKKLKAFYNQAFKENGAKKYRRITLKYSNQVVCEKI